MPDPLGLSAAEMRRLGHRVVDAVVDHIEGLPDAPALRTEHPEALLAALGAGALPEHGRPLDELIEIVVGTVLANMQHGDHPRYFARVPGPSSFAGVLGDWLSTGFQGIAASWAGGSGPSATELVVIDWFRQLLGLPDGTEGVLVSGGSTANLVALSCARAVGGAGVVYFSDQAHSCVAKALHVLDVPADHRRVVETGADFRFTAKSAEQIIAADAARGLRPAVLVATAGTTNTGAVDDLDGLARLAARLGMWFHVDAAYGGPARLCAGSGDPLLATAHADSIVLDPHKWLFQPYDIGALLVRRPGALEGHFAVTPEYLRDVAASGVGEVDLRNRGIELTRRSRALKAWMTISSAGRVGLTEAVRRGIERATVAETRLRAGRVWEIVSPAQLGIVTFRHRRRPQSHESAAASLTASGLAAVTCTRLLGQSTLRLCTINPRTTDSDIDDTITALEGLLATSPPNR